MYGVQKGGSLLVWTEDLLEEVTSELRIYPSEKNEDEELFPVNLTRWDHVFSEQVAGKS